VVPQNLISAHQGGRNSPFADERNFIDLKRVEGMATEDDVIVDGPIGSPLVKGVYQLKHRDGMSGEEFRKYWIAMRATACLVAPPSSCH
jgi:hypothetical protein